MDFTERLYRAHIAAEWRGYRQCKPGTMMRAAARRQVHFRIVALREMLASRGRNTHRPAEWAGVYSGMAA